MKKILVTLTATLVCVAAFAQGKVNMANNSLHLAYYSTDGQLRPGDAALAGQGASSALQPAGVTLVVDLYAGATSSSLSLVSTTTFSPNAGLWSGPANVIVPVAGGTAAFFRLDVRDGNFATAAAAASGGSYSGTSGLFSLVPGSSVLYNAVFNHSSPANSTWADGTFNMDTQTGIAGSRGALSVGVIPEPASMALCGLGAAALLIFRRRK